MCVLASVFFHLGRKGSEEGRRGEEEEKEEEEERYVQVNCQT